MSFTFSRVFAASRPHKLARRSLTTFAATTLSAPLLPHVAPSLAPLIVALLLLHARTDDDGGETLPLSTTVPYEVRSIEGAGLGAIAAKELTRGEVIVTDSPLLVWPQGISPAEAETLAKQLTPRARAAFDALADSMPREQGLGEVLGRRATNAFAVQVPEVPQEAQGANDLPDVGRISFLYPNIARINHSCLPNADQAIDWSTLRMTIYASAPIRPGEEVAIEYIPLVAKTRAERQSLLRDNFGFACACSACSRTTAETEASDDRRREVGVLAKRVARDGTRGTGESRKAVVHGLERIRELLEQEGYGGMPEFEDDVVSRAYVLYSTNRAQLLASAA